MKSKIKKRLIAFMLCMVLVLSSAISAFADDLDTQAQDQTTTMADEPVATSMDDSTDEQQPVAEAEENQEQAVETQEEQQTEENVSEEPTTEDSSAVAEQEAIEKESDVSIQTTVNGTTITSAKLFTDIDQLKVGDKFYIHVLDEVLAYKVDQILPMVDKDDHETLKKALQIEEGKDQVTLFTCTPYGVNSHRLLVRGTRVPYNGEEDATESVTDSMVKAIQNYYMLYLVLGLSITILVIILLRFLSKRKAHKE